MHERMIKVWCLQRDQFGHTRPVEAAFAPGTAQFIYDDGWEPAAMLAAAPDLVLTVNDHPYEIARCLEAARAHGIPSLVLQDGILEWRCQYENPLFGAGGGALQHQPVLADKIACIGLQSARQIAAWGNAGKVEVTGMPRLDDLVRDYQAHGSALTAPAAPGRRPRVLVMTAKKPGFTPEQMAVTLESLRDVKAYFAARPDIDVIWRVTKLLDHDLGVENHLTAFDSLDLIRVIDQVDAVITTVSTAILEAMLRRRPVAALDYHNTPRFVETAWTISAPGQIAPVVDALLHPSAVKLAYQRERLADTLVLEPAAPRVKGLIEAMVTHAQAAKAAGTALALPPALLPFDLYPGVALPTSALYPEHTVYQETDLDVLRQQLARLEKAYAQVKAHADERSLGYWIRTISVRASRYASILRRKVT
ncbi:MAG: hypothetical protein SF162_20255 [bacterium]|nr:hypothetical protein [bacterium]